MIVGLTGYKRTGKDTFADLLQNHLGFNRWAFADKLRSICSEMFEIPVDVMLTDGAKDAIDERYGMSPRDILITVGTEGFRKCNPNIWCDYVINQLKKNPEQNHVVTDIRFPNEYHAIKAIGGIVVRVEREGCVLGNDIPTSGLYGLGLDDGIITIENNGTLNDLAEKMRKIVRDNKEI